MDIGDAFYYPQRFLIPIVIGFMTFIALFIVVIGLVVVLLAALNEMKINVHKTSYAFINSASSNAMLFKQAFTDSDMKPVEDVIEDINGYFDQILVALLVGLIIALTLSGLFFMVSIIGSLAAYKKDVLDLRKGKWNPIVPRETFEIKESVDYSGIVISNFLIGFAIVVLTLGLVFIVLSMKLLWEYLYENIWVVVMLLAPMVAEKVVMFVLESSTLKPLYVFQRQYDAFWLKIPTNKIIGYFQGWIWY